MFTTSQRFGHSAEDKAVQLLRKKGYRILGRNVRLAGGELDLIADDQGVLVFIEVKARRDQHFGGAAYAITSQKKTANYQIGRLLSFSTQSNQPTLSV